MEEKLDIHNSEKYYPGLIQRLKQDKSILKENKDLILEFLRDCELGKTIKKGQKKKIHTIRLLRLAYALMQLSRWFNKPFSKVTQKDMENFILKLENGKIKTKKGKSFTSESQITIKKIIRKFYKWLLGNSVNYPDLVIWIDTSGKIPEIESISRDKINKIINKTGNIKHKALLYFMFDSGARPDEALNIKVKDLIEKDNFYKVRIVYSKTKPRTISVNLATPYLKDWLKEHPEEDDPESYIFSFSYNSMVKILVRLGKKIKIKLNPRILRHSSATYYANIIRSRAQLCYRYGWALSSAMPDRYIDRNGLLEEETSEAVKVDEISKIKEEFGKLRDSYDFLKSRFDELENMMFKSDEVLVNLLQNDPKLLKNFLSAVKKGNLTEQLKELIK